MSSADQPVQTIVVASQRLAIERWRAGGTIVVAARPEVASLTRGLRERQSIS